MNKAKALSVSIIIPVYNEEHHIAKCLDAISKQTIMPDEVVVVDNNCTDKTVEIAKSYDFVRVVEEKQQGRSVSRTKGFNSATSDILGRIDADSVVRPNWVERLHHDFSDPEVCGVAGLGKAKFVLGTSWRSTFWTKMYLWAVQSSYRAMTMWGANMAIRKKSWNKIKNHVAKDGRFVHEDQDIALEMAGRGERIIQDNKLIIDTNGTSYVYWPKFWNYFKKSIRMKRYHDKKGTLAKKSSIRLSYRYIIFRMLISYTFGVIFIIYSFLAWPYFWWVISRDRSALEKMR